MAVTQVLRALEAEATARFERIRQRAEREARTIREGAEERCRPLREEAFRRVQPTLAAERSRRLGKAAFAVRREVAGVQEEVLAGVFQEAMARLNGLRRLSCYPAVFRSLAREALTGVRGRVRAVVAAEDLVLATETLRELGAEAEVEPGLSSAGGLRLEAGEGRIVIDNTVEARLAQAEHFLRPAVNRLLFGGGGR